MSQAGCRPAHRDAVVRDRWARRRPRPVPSATSARPLRAPGPRPGTRQDAGPVAVRRQSHDSAPPVWYSVTRVSKKFFSFLRSIISLIHGNGFSAFEQLIEADLLAAPVGDVAQVFLEHRGVQAEHAARHGVLGVAVLELDRLLDQRLDLVAELARPQLRVLDLDLLMRSMPKLQCIDSSRRMYWYCSAAPVILFCRPSARICVKPT